MDDNETIDDIAEKIRQDGWEISGLLIPDDGGKTRAMLPGLADRIKAARNREQIGRDTLSDGRSLTVAVAEQRLHFARVEAEYAGMLNMAAAREALKEIHAWCHNQDNPDCLVRENCEELAIAALAAPARNCDLIANELSIAPERVPDALNKCENAPIRELIRWIFAKAESKGGMSKPEPEESAVAAVALMLGAYASRLEDAYNRPPRKEDGAE